MRNQNGKPCLDITIGIIVWAVAFFAPVHAETGKKFIELNNDPEYGQLTDWQDLVLREVTSRLLVASDGSAFLADIDRHQIIKFNPSGELEIKIGQKGQGPGDLNYPSLCGFLNGRHIIVSGHSQDHSISLFETSGKFFKRIKTSQDCYDALGLQGNSIAYISQKMISKDAKESWLKNKIFVYIKDIQSGAETEVYQTEVTDKSRITSPMQPGWATSAGNFSPEVVMAASKDGHLLVGRTDSPVLQVFDFSGKKINTIKLDLTPTPVTPAYIKSFKTKTLDDFQERLKQQNIKSSPITQIFNSFDFSKIFDANFPLYRGLTVLPDGRMLVAHFPTLAGSGCPFVCRVYSPDGRPGHDIQFDYGSYSFYGTRPSLSQFFFSNDKAYTIVKEIKNDDEFMRIIRIPLPLDRI